MVPAKRKRDVDDAGSPNGGATPPLKRRTALAVVVPQVEVLPAVALMPSSSSCGSAASPNPLPPPSLDGIPIRAVSQDDLLAAHVPGERRRSLWKMGFLRGTAERALQATHGDLLKADLCLSNAQASDTDPSLTAADVQVFSASSSDGTGE